MFNFREECTKSNFTFSVLHYEDGYVLKIVLNRDYEVERYLREKEFKTLSDMKKFLDVFCPQMCDVIIRHCIFYYE